MESWLKKSLFLSAGLVLLLSGCGGNTNPSDAGSGDKLNVVTTFYPMYEFSKQIAGEHAGVVALIPSGVEPHDWEPSPQDMVQIKEADIFVYNGGIEQWVDNALSSAANDKRIVVEASSGIELMEGVPDGHDHGHGEEVGHEEEHGHEEAADHEEEHGHEEAAGHEEEHGHEEAAGREEEHGHEETAGREEEHGHEEGADHEIEHEHSLDPHVWLDPVLAQQEVATIQAAFEQADPANADNYRKNADANIANLKELDDAFQSGLQDAARREFVTQHAAFGYLAKRYGLTQVPISGISPDQEPAPDQMAEIVRFAGEHQVKTIFFETLVEPKVAQAVADEIGAKTDVLNPLEGLTEEDQNNNLDYIGIMKNNLEALKKALNE